MFFCVIIINFLAISSGVENKYFMGFSESTGRLYTRDAVILIATTETDTSVNDPNARKSFSTFGTPCVTWGWKKGVCMRYNECFQNVTQRDIYVETTCYDEKTKKYGVCCTKKLESITQNARQISSSDDILESTPQIKGSSNNKNLSFIWENPLWDTGRQSISCGVQDSQYGRIIGGRKARPGQWPWMVEMIKDNLVFCGASVITNQHALTAAHCMRTISSTELAKMRARLGETERGPSLVSQIKRAVSHRQFTKETLISDISIITIRYKVSFNKYIRPICLPSPHKSYAGVMATVAGWGRLYEDGPLPKVLHEVTLKIWTNSDCAAQFGAAAPAAGIVDSMMCAGQEGKDSCSGDSGGPLMVKDGRTWVAAGVVSWGFECGETEYPGCYTRVSSFLAWIKANLKK